jgi:hypothetical protein
MRPLKLSKLVIRSKKILLKIYNKDAPTVLFLFLPYLLQNFIFTQNSKYYSHGKYLTILLIIIFVQILFSYLFQTKIRLLLALLIVVYSFFVVFLYGADIINFVRNLSILPINFKSFRGREILFFFYLFLLFFEIWLWLLRRSKTPIHNYFWIAFTFTSIFHYFGNNHNVEDISIGKNRYIEFDEVNDINNSVLLIILDEYASPTELSRVFAVNQSDSMSKQLKKMGWIVRDSFFSNETKTIKSISSMFNFNQNDNRKFLKSPGDSNTFNKFFSNAQLADTLTSKGVEIVNYGIFDLGSKVPETIIHYHSNSFFEELINGTIFPLIVTNTAGFNSSYFLGSSYSTTLHNMELFERLRKLNVKSKQFIYAHLYMPHSPFDFGKEFENRPIDTKNYFEFWKFTNNKIISLLKDLSQKKCLKIILTGDHGYRGDSAINPQVTFAAFYGFREELLQKDLTVQDLGSVISCQFK